MAGPSLTKKGRNRIVLAISLCFPLATLAVILRFMARKISRAGIWYDDWLTFAGWLALGVGLSLILSNIPSDSAIRGEPIPDHTLVVYAKTAYVSQMFYFTIQFCLKSSILVFYWRVFKTPSIHMPIYLIACFVAAWFIASIFVSAFQCTPVASLWVPALRSSAKCIEVPYFYFSSSIPNILSDLFLLILPMPYIWGLKITLTQKCFVIGMFLLGGFVTIASALRLRTLLQIDHHEGFPANWTLQNVVVWSVVECCTGVICACLPSLRPIVRVCLPWVPGLGNSMGSSRTSGPAAAASALKHGPSKSKLQQHDEYELLERDCVCCQGGMGRSVEGHSIHTTEESIAVQTKATVSLNDVKQPIDIV